MLSKNRIDNTTDLTPGKVPGPRPVANEGTYTVKATLTFDHEVNVASHEPTQERLELAIPRRADWTPPKEINSRPLEDDSSPIVERTNNFPESLMRSFSFDGSPTKRVRPRPKPSLSNGTMKRQKIEFVSGLAESSVSKPKAVDKKNPNKPAAKKRNKSPAKKSMTITGLATSRYFGQDDSEKESLMMQYLSATQARTVDEIEEASGNDRIAKPSKPKACAQKSRKQKSKLMSPQSAIKAVEEQDTIFGSASQLARDEESLPLSRNEPVWTQQTQPISIESTTPRSGRGTSRFMKTRNLWGVAARDEDNALLQVDSVDLFDTPAVRVAFTGKDVLLEPDSTIDLRLAKAGRHRVADIDDFDSPLLRSPPSKIGMSSKRGFHTSASAGSPSRTTKDLKVQPQRERTSIAETNQVTAQKTSKPAPKKPSYAGFTTHDLQKQLSAFGFKPVKKREKMIELLDQCWEEKHGKDTPDADDPTLKHGDFLSRVHDVASRPQPKMKKLRKRAKDEKVEGETSPRKTTKRRKKTAQADEGQETPKRVRKRKDKTSTAAEPKVIDVDELDSPLSAALNDRVKGTIRALTPPPSKPNQAYDLAEREIETLGTLLTPPQSGENAIGQKIHAAIMRQSEDSSSTDRNHQSNPTWHEKILLYDPITLEDLTVWLNTEGLGLVSEDREVSPIEVRDWCESNGICCLWKGGWRGQKLNGHED